MAEIKEILEELEKVNLAPILMPVLKALDPLMGSLPKGTLKSMLPRKGTQDGLVETVEGLAPVLPTLIRFLGNVSKSKLLTGVLSSLSSISTPIIKLSAPVASKLVVPSVGPALKLVSGLSPVLPSLIKGLGSLVRTEVTLERGLKRVFSFS